MPIISAIFKVHPYAFPSDIQNYFLKFGLGLIPLIIIQVIFWKYNERGLFNLKNALGYIILFVGNPLISYVLFGFTFLFLHGDENLIVSIRTPFMQLLEIFVYFTVSLPFTFLLKAPLKIKIISALIGPIIIALSLTWNLIEQAKIRSIYR